MKDESRQWLTYADENLQGAHLLLDSGLFNLVLQNVQQAVEKMLKSMLVEKGVKFPKTHSINELCALLKQHGVLVPLDDDERDLLDSIYLPSKYPFDSSLPDFEPNAATCVRCIEMAQRVRNSIGQ